MYMRMYERHSKHVQAYMTFSIGRMNIVVMQGII
jgi:hypothetical protein